ncbi:MAG TPA: argininosuccinate lyase [Gemmatimonadaceae bacterium]|nr:argininosuccinate lyase [Gemmatimonadaceae bacterium]
MKRPPPPGDASRGDGAGESHKLWGGRFKAPPAAALSAVNRSIEVDFRLWPYDVRGSQAWASALEGAGVLTAGESGAIRDGLAKVGRRFESGELPVDSDEDVHTMIDRLLHDEIGDVASKLHTGRSRNDQVATATRLWSIVACDSIEAEIRSLQSVIVEHAAALTDAVMPAYTHLQRAQPVSVAHWMLSHFWPLERDVTRISIASVAASSMPLGSGAIAGSAYRVPRDQLMKSLGLMKLSENSVDAVGDRDFIADLLYAISMLGVHLSRLAEDMILFGSSEFGFVRFGDMFTTGSSMMPQKRNPDVMEIARGFGARSLGALTALLATLKGLPSGYNKDLQDDKRILFEAVDATRLVLPAVAGALAECTFNADVMERAVSSGMMATDLADYLVGKGVSFREAHGAVGSLVRAAEDASCELGALPAERFTATHSAFGADARDWLDARASIARRDLPGGTGPNAVREQVQAARSALAQAMRQFQAESGP